jgi:hypothetical protein
LPETLGVQGVTGTDAAAQFEAFLDATTDLETIGRANRTWDVLVPSYWKESIAVSFAFGDRSLRGEAFFMRAPEENQDRVYHLLLQRNERAHLWKFAANSDGDASLVAEVPFESINAAALDVLFGALVTLVDETYVPYMKLGFENALREQERAGGPGLKRPPWAAKWEASPDRPT